MMEGGGPDANLTGTYVSARFAPLVCIQVGMFIIYIRLYSTAEVDYRR